MCIRDSPKTVWTYELGSLLEAITSLPGNYFLLGDYNADLIAPDKPPKDGRSLLDLLVIYNLHNLISSPIRITKTSITLLDLVITNNKIKVFTSGVVHVQCVSLVCKKVNNQLNVMIRFCKATLKFEFK